MTEGEKLSKLLSYISQKVKGDQALLWKALLADRLEELERTHTETPTHLDFQSR